MILGIFSSQYRSEGKALAAVSIVSNGDQIGIRVITDGVDARHFTTTDMIYSKIFLVCRILLPSLFAVDVLYDFEVIDCTKDEKYGRRGSDNGGESGV